MLGLGRLEEAVVGRAKRGGRPRPLERGAHAWAPPRGRHEQPGAVKSQPGFKREAAGNPHAVLQVGGDLIPGGVAREDERLRR